MKQIKGYPDYFIDENGNVYSKKSGRYLRGSVMTNGYKSVELFTASGKSKRLLVHRLVADAFIPNPDGLPVVNHKDESRDNNSVDNLEWCTHKYNVNYGTAPERRAKGLEGFRNSERIKETARKNGKAVCIPVTQLTKAGEIVAEYASGKEASIKTGINHAHIMANCAGKGYKSAGGYRWQYKERT